MADIINVMYKLHKFVHYILCKTTKSISNRILFTNRENIQKIFEKVVDNAGLVWYHNHAVTKRTDRKKAERQKSEAE